MSKAEFGLRLRDARLDDAGGIAELSDQLGYPVSEAKMRRRLERLQDSVADRVIVAELPEAEPPNRLVGWVHVSLSLHVESGEFAEIAGLVIDAEHRGRGVGERLLRRAEAWARECGVDRVRVRTNVRREEAHRFYERLGYVREKSQHVFQRKLWRI